MFAEKKDFGARLGRKRVWLRSLDGRQVLKEQKYGVETAKKRAPHPRCRTDEGLGFVEHRCVRCAALMARADPKSSRAVDVDNSAPVSVFGGASPRL